MESGAVPDTALYNLFLVAGIYLLLFGHTFILIGNVKD